MQQTNLRCVFREEGNIEGGIVEFLRNKDLNKDLAELLRTFNDSVVEYAPTLEEITLQDLIVAHQDGKLSQEQMNSIDGFLKFAAKFIQIRIGVISTVESEISIPVPEMTDAEKNVLEQVLQSRFTGMKIGEFTGTINGTAQTTQREILKIDSQKLQEKGGNNIQDGIRNFIERIKSNIFMKQNSPEGGWIERAEESENYVDTYIEKLLDIETPLDKALLKTIPLDLTFEQQKEVITKLIQRLFPQICDGTNMGFIANSLDIFPNVGGKNGIRTKNSRGFKFGKSISEGYLRQILDQDEQSKTHDKFMTTALRRIIVPLRFLIMKSKMDIDFVEGNDAVIHLIPESRLEKLLHDINIDDTEVSSDIESITKMFLDLTQVEKREFLKRITASIVGVSYNKIDLSHVDSIIGKYVGSVAEYNRIFVSPLSQILKDNADNKSITSEKVREVFYALACLRKVKELDTGAEIVYKGDEVTSDDQLKTYEEAHTASAEQEEIAQSNAKANSNIDKSETENLDFFVVMCSEFESNDAQYSDDVSTLLAEFSTFDDDQKKYICGILGFRLVQDVEAQKELLTSFLYKKYLENSDLCTKMLHIYKQLMKAKRKLDDSIKQRDLDRILQGYGELNSQDQSKFLGELGIDQENEDNLSDILYERVFSIKKPQVKKSLLTYSESVEDLRIFLLSHKRGLQSGTISKKTINHVKASIQSFGNEELQKFLETTFSSAMEGTKIIHKRIPILLGKTIKSIDENKDFFSEVEKFMKGDTTSIDLDSKVRLLIELFVKNGL